ncbi:ATP-binding protein [Kitasatospora viridis]|uniref:Putative ATPase n=1 Tax=Kitasatospora viridis TaxID=281105 RepID=A0A561UAH8_9ACTN|nr:regulator [Kitasatospora viridis]TWF96370.1 putative ATPase [Kitasatospora viridis]
MERQSTARRGNLPAELTSFTGRHAELAALAALLTGPRLVTVTGPGGVGKTRLALRAAALAAEEAFLVEVGELHDPLLLGHAVLTALGLTDGTARPPLDVLVEQLAERRLLLVLDGCEHLVAACAELTAALLRALPRLRVLATSREALRTAGEHLLPVAPLPVGAPPGVLPEAVRLFADRAAAVLPGFELRTEQQRAEAVALCRRLDGIPLALELAAGRLRALSVRQIALRLDDRFELLTGGDRGAAPRHRTLRTAIGWSHELCSMQERLLWARLSVFAGDFDLEAAEHVCAGDGLDSEQVLDLLGELVAKSVLLRIAGPEGPQGHPVRYRLLDTLRDYGAGWLRGSGAEHRLRRRHRDWYLGLATWGELEWFGPRQAETAERTSLEHSNLRAALEFCLGEPGEEQLALLLAGTLWYFWVGCGHLGEGRHWLERALALDRTPTDARAKALWVTGYTAILQGDRARALPLLEECRRQALARGDDRALAYALHRLGCAALIGDEPARAAELFREALERYEAVGELNSNVLMAVFELGLAHLFQGELAEGEECMARVRTVCEEHGEQWAYAYGLYARAYSQWLAGEVRQARAFARESVRLHFGFRDLVGIVLGLELLALLETERGELLEARLLQGAAHRIWQAVGVPLFGSAGFNAAHRECARRARAGLTEAEFADAFDRGGALDLPTAVHRALGEQPSAEAHAAATDCVLLGRRPI